MLDSRPNQTDNADSNSPATLALSGLVPVRIDISDADAATPSDGQTQHTREAASVAPHSANATPVLRVAVWAVIPCYNRARDLQLLFRDLVDLELNFEAPCNLGLASIELRLLVIDNASDSPLSEIAPPSGLSIEFLRLSQNTGGSGGFSTGLARTLALADEHARSSAHEASPPFIWLLDSDARVVPGTLRELVRVLLARPDAAAIGSAIADPLTGRVFELGGIVDARTGMFKPKLTGVAGVPGPIECQYVAACSALVRTDAAARTGPFPDLFINADDVVWFIRMARATGQKILASPASVVIHPTFDRFATTARYYVSRNCLVPLRELGFSTRVRFLRAMHEVRRAVVQDINLRHACARLHLAGLADAARPIQPSKAPPTKTSFDPLEPLIELARKLSTDLPGSTRRVSIQQALLDTMPAPERIALTEQVATILSHMPGATLDVDHGSGNGMKVLTKACLRWLAGPRYDLSIVHASAGCPSWFAGKVMVQVAPGAGYFRRNADPGARLRAAWRGLCTLVVGTRAALRAARYQGPLFPSPPPALLSTAVQSQDAEVTRSTPPLSMAIIVLSYNRREKLRRTLFALTQSAECQSTCVIVVDNASTDGSAAMVATEFPQHVLIPLQSNIGVAALNVGVEAANTDLVLVLDDDAHPGPGILAAATDLLTRRADLAAVTFHPVHPASQQSEWPFAASLHGQPDDRWPVMGCGNLVRRESWIAAGGYEPTYFLYRNDTDLAMKLLATRAPASSTGPFHSGVHFNPAWIVWHDSEAAATKSPLWHRLATRNWIWTARRHGQGLSKLLGIMLGILWSHRLAGLRPACHWATMKGTAAGLFARPPGLPTTVAPSGRDFDRLLNLRIRRSRR